MDWLVHHDFGLHHQPFAFGGMHVVELPPDTLDFGLAQWINYSSHLLPLLPKQLVHLIQYEDLLANPRATITTHEQATLINLSAVQVPPHEKKSSNSTRDVDLRLHDRW